MTVQEGIDAMDNYFGGTKEEAFARIGNPCRKKKAVEPIECEDIDESEYETYVDSDEVNEE